MGQGKALYALDDSGAYTMVRSAGWEAEEIVLNQAIEECERQARDAHARARRGETSPLEYHMFQRRMDVVVLAQSVGLFKWQVKRHLRPHTFASLSPRLRGRYAEALGLSVDALNSLPDVP
jgi:hypothetical protein